MPADRTPTKNIPTKSYIKPGPDVSSESSAETPIKTKTKTKANITPTKGKAWTGEEYQMLFQYAMKTGAPGSDSGWEGVVPGRTGGQARNAWRGSVAPGCMKCLKEKGL